MCCIVCVIALSYITFKTTGGPGALCMSTTIHHRLTKTDRDWRRRYSTERSCKICNISNKYIFIIISLANYLSSFVFDSNFICLLSNLTVSLVVPRHSWLEHRHFSYVWIWNHRCAINTSNVPLIQSCTERNNKNFHFRNALLKLHLKFSGKRYLSPCNLKRIKFL